MKIELNADEVREIMEAYFQSIGAPVEIKSIMVTYEQVVMDATLNPQPTAPPRQFVEPASYNLPPIEPLGAAMADGNITTLESNALFLGSDGRRLTEDEVRKLHE